MAEHTKGCALNFDEMVPQCDCGFPARADYEDACANLADRWVIACGGMESPFEKNGVRYLYVFNPASHKHGWLDLGQDIVFDSLPS